MIVHNEFESIVVPRPAATVMLLRDGERGLEVYLARRSERSRFMPGAYVFPGGAVDAGDRSAELWERTLGLPGVGEADPAFALAALRETFEEAGILLCARPDGSPVAFSATELAEMRAAVADGASLADVVHARGAAFDARGLVHYSNWVTPVGEPLRFDTHFFAARAPLDQHAADDAIEMHDGRWLAASDALARAASGELTIVFPTLKHLERIAAQRDVDAFLTHARARTVARVTPIESESGPFAVMLETDAW